MALLCRLLFLPRLIAAHLRRTPSAMALRPAALILRLTGFGAATLAGVDVISPAWCLHLAVFPVA